MVVSRSCIQMVLSQVWSKLVCSNGKWIRKSGLTQPLMWLKRRSGGNWNVQALQPCMFLEMYRPYNPVCFFCLVCTHKPGWCDVPKKRWFPHQVWHVPKQNGSGTYSYKDFFWPLSGLGELWSLTILYTSWRGALENLTNPHVGWSVWNWWPQSDQEGEIVRNY